MDIAGPGSAASAPGGVFRVLMVCTANICRSPAAERLLALELSQRDLADTLQVRISSAGVRGWDGSPMDTNAAAALEARGGSAEGFAGRSLTGELAARASVILTATREHRAEVVEHHPSVLRRAFTMKELPQLLDDAPQTAAASDLIAYAYRHRGGARLTDIDVADPYGGSDDAHAVAAQQIHEAMTALADHLARCSHA